MFFLMLAAMGEGAAVTDPSVNTPTVATNNAGACTAGSPDPEASIRVSWTITNSAAGYTTKVYENDILVSSQAITLDFYDKTVTGAVQNGPNGSWNADWTYRVDIVRTSDGSVVSSGTSSQWTQLYGSC